MVLCLLQTTKYSVFQFFSKLTLFCCLPQITAVVILWKISLKLIKALSHWWPLWCQKRISGLREIEKTWTFSDAHKSWRKLATFLFFFIVLVKIVASLKGRIFFHLLVRFKLKFPVLHFYWNVCNGVPQLIWLRKDWFWSVFLEAASFGCHHFSMD